MDFWIPITVQGTKATVGELPFLAAGSVGEVGVAVTCDEVWDRFSRKILVRRDETLLEELTLDADGRCALPARITEDGQRFWLAVEGSYGSCRLRTNRVCLSFRGGEHGGGSSQIVTYDGPYTMTENGVYPTAGKLCSRNLTVAVPQNNTGVDTSGDTVTPETLLLGITAHNAQGQAITGSYAPPDVTGGTNVVYAPAAPDDPDLLWVKTTAQMPNPQVERVGYLSPAWQNYASATVSPLLNPLFWMDSPDGICVYGTTASYQGASGYTPRVLEYRPDGSVEEIATWAAASSDYDLRACAGCVTQDYIYLLMGAANSSTSTTNKRVARLLIYDRTAGTVSTVSVATTMYYALKGGVCVAEDGAVYLYVSATTSASGGYSTRFYRYAEGTLTQMGTVQTGYALGGSGMAVVNGMAYSLIGKEANGAVTALGINTETDTIVTWQVQANPDTAALLGSCGGMLKVSDTDGLAYLAPATGKLYRIPLQSGADSVSESVVYRDWMLQGDTAVVIGTRGSGSTLVYQYAALARKATDSSAILMRREGGGTLLPVIRSGALTVEVELCGALVTDAAGYWQNLPLCVYDAATEDWVDIS